MPRGFHSAIEQDSETDPIQGAVEQLWPKSGLAKGLWHDGLEPGRPNKESEGGRSLPGALNPRLGLGDSGLKPGRFLLKHGYPVVGLHVLLMS